MYLENFIAASIASVPELHKNTWSSPLGVMVDNNSTNLSLVLFANAPDTVIILLACSYNASLIFSFACPIDATAIPPTQSIYSFPLLSHTNAPFPFYMLIPLCEYIGIRLIL